MAGSNVIIVGARSSPLSKAQVREVQCEINRCHPEIIFEAIFLETYGDRDRTTSLRILNKTDFFTREVDDLLLSGACRIAIHSAKDLPDPLRKGIAIIALTRGEDPSDSLVLRQGESLSSLSPGAIIATSSQRREEAVKQLRSDVAFVDLRGTIGERLAMIEHHDVDGVVIAEAALIRLKMTRLNRIKLPGETVKHQGQLAVMAQCGDKEMCELFASIDSRIFAE
jgi:hydroxymethylbilane synthase